MFILFRLSSFVLGILLLGASFAFADTHSLQVSSWRTAREAEKVTEKLRAKKLNANFREKQMPTGTWYGVFIDGYTTRKEARAEGKRLVQQKIISEYIVRGQDNSFDPNYSKAAAKPTPAPVQVVPVQAAPPPPAPVVTTPRPAPAPAQVRPPQPTPKKQPAPKKQVVKQPAKKAPAKKQANKDGVYLDLGAIYYHIPEDNSYADPTYYGSIIGGRLGLGYRLRLSSGYLSLGAESGYMGIKDSIRKADLMVHTFPATLKAGYGLNVAEDILLRLDVRGGALFGYAPEYGWDWDPLIGAMVYGEYKVNDTVGVYLGLGSDYLIEELGNILLPAAEAGVRISF